MRRSSIVPDFRSSANSFIVRTGGKKRRINAICEKSVCITIELRPLLSLVRINITENRNPDNVEKTKQTK